MITLALNLWRDNEHLRFLAVGGWNTLFGYLLFVLLYWLLSASLHYMAIAVVAHFGAVTQSYMTQRHLVFRAARGGWRQFLRFNISNLTALGFGLVCLWLLVDTLGLAVLLAQAITTMASVVLSYLLHKHYSFRP